MTTSTDASFIGHSLMAKFATLHLYPCVFDRIRQRQIVYDKSYPTNRIVYIIHLMSAREGNSFVFPRDSMFPEMKSRETLRFEEKQN